MDEIVLSISVSIDAEWLNYMTAKDPHCMKQLKDLCEKCGVELTESDGDPVSLSGQYKGIKEVANKLEEEWVMKTKAHARMRYTNGQEKKVIDDADGWENDNSVLEENETATEEQQQKSPEEQKEKAKRIRKLKPQPVKAEIQTSENSYGSEQSINNQNVEQMTSSYSKENATNSTIKQSNSRTDPSQNEVGLGHLSVTQSGNENTSDQEQEQQRPSSEAGQTELKLTKQSPEGKQLSETQMLMQPSDILISGLERRSHIQEPGLQAFTSGSTMGNQGQMQQYRDPTPNEQNQATGFQGNAHQSHYSSASFQELGFRHEGWRDYPVSSNDQSPEFQNSINLVEQRQTPEIHRNQQQSNYLSNQRQEERGNNFQIQQSYPVYIPVLSPGPHGNTLQYFINPTSSQTATQHMLYQPPYPMFPPQFLMQYENSDGLRIVSNRHLNALRLFVHFGDIVTSQTAVIVISANNLLTEHGSVSHAVYLAAGERIVDECRNKISQCGQVPPGEMACTSGGNLCPPVENILHAVIPTREQFSSDPNAALECLSLAFYRCLYFSAHWNKSITFPPIGSEVVGLEMTVEAFVRALKLFDNFMTTPCPCNWYNGEIHFVINDGEKLQTMMHTIKRLLFSP